MEDEGKVRVEPTLGGSGVDSAGLPSLEEVLPTPMESRFVPVSYTHLTLPTKA